MAIARNPNRTLDAAEKEKRELAFIAKNEAQAEAPAPQQSIDQNKKPTMIRINPDMLIRIDRAAKRLGISRSAFIVSSTAEKLERME